MLCEPLCKPWRRCWAARQSLHTNSLDEAYALPSEQAVTLALRTQQIIAYETGVTNTPDPLGGSYFLERLTLDIEQAANEYIRRIDQMGGMIPAIEAGFPQREIAAASYRYQCEIEREERIIVGANRFQSEDAPIELLQIDQSAETRQQEKLACLRLRRDKAAVDKTLSDLAKCTKTGENTMPYLLEAVRGVCDLRRDLRYASGHIWYLYRNNPPLRTRPSEWRLRHETKVEYQDYRGNADRHRLRADGDGHRAGDSGLLELVARFRGPGDQERFSDAVGGAAER